MQEVIIIKFKLDIGSRIPFMKHLVTYLQVNVVIVGYRGYGRSEGKPTERGLMYDAEAILNYTFNNPSIENDKIYLLGVSLGGAVAIYSAAEFKKKYNFRGIILENTFTSLDDLVDGILGWGFFVKYILLHNHWPSKQRIKQIKTPILFIISEFDEIIPTKMMENLFTLAKNTSFKDKYIVKNATHNTTYLRGREQYFNKLYEFITKTLESENNIN